MKNRRALILLLLFSALFFLLGYFRNYIFLNINERAALIYYHEKYPPLPDMFSMFENYDYNNLLTVKWVLTLVFTLTYTVLSAITLYFIYNSKAAALTTTGINIFLFMVSLLFIGLGKLIPAFAYHGFNISRSIAHFQQSPVIAILLLLGFYAFGKK